MSVSASDPAAPAPQARSAIAARLWDAARREFSLRGYNGARVQGIARHAGCNVALLYRYWASKKALYLEVLRAVWQERGARLVALIAEGTGAPGVVGAYLDAALDDPAGSQLLVREYLDGAPFLAQLAAQDPTLVEPLRRAVAALDSGWPVSLRPGLDPVLAALTIGGLCAFVASAHEAAGPFIDRAVTRGAWRKHLYDLLLHGLLPGTSPGS